MRRHLPWFGLLLASAALGLFIWQEADARLAVAQTELTREAAKSATLARELTALEKDAAASAALRAEIGDDAWRNLLAPPPRAQIVAALRAIGQASGLATFDLTLGKAGPAARPAGAKHALPDDWAMTESLLTIKASAASDAILLDFTRRVAADAPAYLRLEKLMLNRAAGDIAVRQPGLVTGVMQLRWIGLHGDLRVAGGAP